VASEADPAPARSWGTPHPRVRLLVTAALLAAGIFILVWAIRADLRWFELNTLLDYCAGEPTHLPRAAHRRELGFVVGLFLLFAAIPLGRAAGRRSAGALLGGTLRITLAALLALVACDLVLRWKGKGPPKPYHFRDLPDGQPDAALGWVLTPHAHKEVWMQPHPISYDVDAMGDRAPSVDWVPDFGRPTILFAGESVMIGQGVEYAEAFPTLVGADLGLQSVNLSVPAYGNDQSYLRLRKELPRFSRPVAVVTMAMPLQLERDVADYRMTLRLGPGGSLVEHDASPAWLQSSPLLFIWRGAHVYHGTEAVDVARAILSETARLVRSRNAVPLFLYADYMPWCFEGADGQTTPEHAMFDGLGVDHVRVRIPKDRLNPLNIHPNAQSHREMADVVETGLRAAGVGQLTQ
jgi:hypothetical protein